MLAFIPLCDSLLCRSLWSKLVVNDRQQDPPHLALCSSRRSGLRWADSFLIEYPAQKLFHTLLLLVNLSVSIMISWVVEEQNDLGFKCHPVMLPDFGDFEKYYYKIVHGLTLLHGSLRVARSLLPAFILILPHRLWWYRWSFDGWGRMSSAWPKSVARSKIGSTGVYSYLRLIRLVHR